jgi:hypothetical protein
LRHKASGFPKAALSGVSEVYGSAVVGNIAANTGTGVDFVFGFGANSFDSDGDNLIGDGNATGAFTQGGDQTAVADPGLGPLADNGGPTQTHAPLAGSPAIDAVTGTCPPPDTDQRGVTRPQGAA